MVTRITDSSKSKSGTGAAAVILQPDGVQDCRSWKLSDHTSPLQAECLAIYLVLTEVVSTYSYISSCSENKKTPY
jgi:hypothetical protein